MLTVATHEGNQLTSSRVAFNAGDGNTLTIELDDLDLRFQHVLGAPAFVLCGPDAAALPGGKPFEAVNVFAGSLKK